MDRLKIIDSEISDIAGKLDFYAGLTPLNQKAERAKFFDSFKNKDKYNPVFEYTSRDFFSESQRLKKLSAEIKKPDKSLLGSLFLMKIDYITRQIALLNCEDEQFGALSSGLYGCPSEEDMDVSRKILVQVSKKEHIFPEETVSAGKMRDIIERKLAGNNIKGWKVALSDKIVPKLSVSGRDRNIYVNPSLNYTREEIQRLMVHEIEVHVYRALNGANQPFRIFAEGLAGYDETEEGLAVTAEEKAGCLDIDKRQIKLYAGRCLAVRTALNESFFDTFITLKNYFPDEIAYRLTERVKRGLKNTRVKGAFTKDMHYVSGFNKLKGYIDGKGDLKILYTGKIGLPDAGLVGELVKDGVLKRAEYFPEYISDNK
jgi:uncharacterized protein (TIGR02421 family)